jgi:hypothetical protein
MESPVDIQVNGKNGVLNYTFEKSNINYFRDYLVPGEPLQTVIYMKGSEKGIVIQKNVDDVRALLRSNSELVEMIRGLDVEKIKLVKEFIKQM